MSHLALFAVLVALFAVSGTGYAHALGQLPADQVTDNLFVKVGAPLPGACGDRPELSLVSTRDTTDGLFVNMTVPKDASNRLNFVTHINVRADTSNFSIDVYNYTSSNDGYSYSFTLPHNLVRQISDQVAVILEPEEDFIFTLVANSPILSLADTSGRAKVINNTNIDFEQYMTFDGFKDSTSSAILNPGGVEKRISKFDNGTSKVFGGAQFPSESADIDCTLGSVVHDERIPFKLQLDFGSGFVDDPRVIVVGDRFSIPQVDEVRCFDKYQNVGEVVNTIGIIDSQVTNTGGITTRSGSFDLVFDCPDSMRPDSTFRLNDPLYGGPEFRMEVRPNISIYEPSIIPANQITTTCPTHFSNQVPHTTLNDDGSLRVSYARNFNDVGNAAVITYYKITGTADNALRVWDWSVSGGRDFFTIPAAQYLALFTDAAERDSTQPTISPVASFLTVQGSGVGLNTKFISRGDIELVHYTRFNNLEGEALLNSTITTRHTGPQGYILLETIGGVTRDITESIGVANSDPSQGLAFPPTPDRITTCLGATSMQSSHLLPPSIKMTGDGTATGSPISVNHDPNGEPFVLPASVCTSSRGDDVPVANVTTLEPLVDTSVLGDYTYNFECVDQHNGIVSAQGSRQVRVADMEPPMLTFEPYVLAINGTFHLDLGVNCVDAGDLTLIPPPPPTITIGLHNLTAVIIDGESILTTSSEDEVYSIEYQCTDSAGNENATERFITGIADTEPPKLINDHPMDLVIDADTDMVRFTPEDIFRHPVPICLDETPGDIPPDEPRFKSLPVTTVITHNYLGNVAERNYLNDPRDGNLTRTDVGESLLEYSCVDRSRNEFDTMDANATTNVVLTSATPQIVQRNYIKVSDGSNAGHLNLELNRDDLYRETGADCLFPNGEINTAAEESTTLNGLIRTGIGGKEAMVGGARVVTTTAGEYSVEYACTYTADDAGPLVLAGATVDTAPVGSSASLIKLVTILEPVADMRPLLLDEDLELIDGTEKITHSVGSKFDEAQVQCAKHNALLTNPPDPMKITPGATDLLLLITAAKFTETSPIEVRDEGDPNVGITGKSTAGEKLVSVLNATLEYGVQGSNSLNVNFGSGVTVAEFIRKAPPGQYEAQFDCHDTAIDTLRRAAITITIISSGSDDDWKLDPTFGRSWDSGVLVVNDGFSFNGRSFDVVDNYHVDFERTTSVIGQTNTVTMKAYAQTLLDTLILSLGVPELSRVTDAETDILVKLRPNYSLEEQYEIVDIIHEQDVELVDPEATAVTVQKTNCNDQTEAVCHELTIQFRILAPLASDVLAISAMDQERRITTTYINDGVEFEGESLLPAETATLHFKRGNQHPVETIHLTQEDRRYNAWSDQYGYAWLQNEYGSWFQLTQAGFERLQDPTVTVMTRTHSGFEDLIQQEREKARAVFDAADIESHVGESFSHDAPVRIDKLSDPKVLEKLRIAEMRAIEYLRGSR